MIIPGSNGMFSSWTTLLLGTFLVPVVVGGFLSFAIAFQALLQHGQDEMKSAALRVGISLDAIYGLIQLAIGVLSVISALYALFHGFMNWLLKGSWHLQTLRDILPPPVHPLAHPDQLDWILSAPVAPIYIVVGGLLIWRGLYGAVRPAGPQPADRQ